MQWFTLWAQRHPVLCWGFILLDIQAVLVNAVGAVSLVEVHPAGWTRWLGLCLLMAALAGLSAWILTDAMKTRAVGATKDDAAS